MSETPQPRHPENLGRSLDMTGLHGRLVVNEQRFLHPDTTLTPQDRVSIIAFEQRSYAPFEQASRKNRKQYWQEKTPNATFDAKIAKWQESTITTLNDKKSSDYIQALEPLFRQTGIDRSSSDGKFTKEHTQLLYNRYFKKTDAQDESGVKRFVTDVLTAYQKNSGIDIAALTRTSDQIAWIANFFGRDGAVMVKHLILAESKLKTQPEQLRQEMTKLHKDAQGNDILRFNNLNAEERKILAFISGAADTITHTTTPDQKPTQHTERKSNDPLPIEKYRDLIQKTIRDNDTTIIVGGTGSGKTTQVPQMIRQILKSGEKMVVTEPRQINTSDLAKRVAKEAGVTLGKEIGYLHGGDDNFDREKTDTLFVTEGTLLSLLRKDPALKDKRVAVIDEAHVQSEDTEKVLASINKAQKLRAAEGIPPLKIVIMSATIDANKFKKHFNNAPVIKVEGRMYEAINKNDRYETRPLDRREKPKRAAEIVHNLIQKGVQGTTIIGVEGQAAIREYAREQQQLNPDAIIVKLHAGATDQEKEESQKEAPKGKHRIIIATDFIQTGITIPDAICVINSGDVIQSTVDHISGLEYTRTIDQSKAEIGQWEGRVNRVSPGYVFNLFTKDDYKKRQDYPTPQLLRSDLTNVLLEINYHNLSTDAFLSSLDQKRLAFAEDTLIKLDALDPKTKALTEIGKRMLELPVDYHLARMVIAADKAGKGIREACIIAAIADNSRNLIPRGSENFIKNRFGHPESDFLMYLNIWNKFRESGKPLEEWATENGFNTNSLAKAENTLNKLRDRITNQNTPPASEDELQQFVFTGYKDRVMRYETSVYSYTWTRENAVCNYNLQINPKSILAGKNPPIIIGGGNSRIQEGKPLVYISQCQTVKPEWLSVTHPTTLAA